jgi:LacI family transcriptional regulator
MGWVRRRHKGFRRTLAAAGRACSAYAYVPESQDYLIQRRQLGQWLESLPKPTGLLCAYDELGRIVTEGCRAVGLRVPEDIAVLGVDDDELFTRLSVPPLSSVPLPWRRVARKAVDMLDRVMRGRPVSTRPQRVKPTQPIAVRRSTDIVAVEEPDVADAVRHIHDHLAEGLTVEALTKQASVSRRSLELKFRKWLGRSPHQEIRRVQVRRIQELLVRTRWSLPRIAEAVGIRGARHMGTMFRAETGMTPDQFRREADGE